MTDDTRHADNLANTQPADIPDLLNLADQIAPAAATVDSIFDERDRDLDVLHWVKRRSQVSLCGMEDGWGPVESGSGPAGPSAVCPLCETLRAMHLQLDVTGLDQMPPR